MELDEIEIIQMELKYCERCGGLWMREASNGSPYCPGCAAWMAGLPSCGGNPFAGREDA
jgi:hypothetical protein